MATPKKEPEKAIEQVSEPERVPETTRTRKYDPRKLVYVYDAVTKEKLTRPVPETHLDGRFPNLKQSPSDARKGK